MEQIQQTDRLPSFRIAEPGDVPRIMEIIGQAQDFLRANGVDQWQDGYPDSGIIREDVASRSCYVAEWDGRITGSAFISFEPEPNYQTVYEGQWQTPGPSAVVHRIAVDAAQRGRGHARALMELAERLCAEQGVGSIKIDTHQDNRSMRGMLERIGYQYCGVIRLEDGSPRVAYEKPLTAGRSILRIEQDKKRFLDLLLLGDEQESMIDRYLNRGELYVLYDPEPRAVAVVTDEGGGAWELKNLAVSPDHHREGYGKAMVGWLLRRYGSRGHTMLVGTGETPSILAFYHACGFRESHRVPGFFTSNYDHPIWEDGVLLTDMVYLKAPLTPKPAEH